MQAVASYPGPISLPPLSADRFTHGDFGKASSPAELASCWWSGAAGLYPSPPTSDFATPPARQRSPHRVPAASSPTDSGHHQHQLQLQRQHCQPSARVALADQRPASSSSPAVYSSEPSTASSSYSSAPHSFGSNRSLPQPDSYARKFSSASSTTTNPLAHSLGAASSLRNGSFVSATSTEASSPTGLKHPALHAQRGRKAKAHVQSACANCKKAHLACDIGRPCTRCISNGKTATCVDVEHKKRGRPRLRDDRGNKTAAAAAAAAASSRYAQSQPLHLSLGLGAREIRPSLRNGHYSGVLASQDPYGRHFASDMTYGSTGSSAMFQSPYGGAAVLPTAFLDTDMRIVKTNDSFRAYFPGMQLHGQKLTELVDPSNWGTLDYLQRQLKDERQSKDNTYLPPPLPDNEARDMPDIDTDYIGQYTASYVDRTQPLNFRFVPGQTHSLNVSFRLAKATSFFVVVRFVPATLVDDGLYGGPTSYFSHPASSYPSSYSQHGGYSGAYTLASGPTSQQPVDSYASAGSQSPFYGMQSVTSPTQPAAGRSDSSYTFMAGPAAAPRSASGYYYAPNGMLVSQGSSEPRMQSQYYQQDVTGHTQQPYSSLSQQQAAQPRSQSYSQSTNVQLPPISNQSDDTSRQRTMVSTGLANGYQYMTAGGTPRSTSSYGYATGDMGGDDGNRQKRQRLDIPGLAQHLAASESYSDNSRGARSAGAMHPPMM